MSSRPFGPLVRSSLDPDVLPACSRTFSPRHPRWVLLVPSELHPVAPVVPAARPPCFGLHRLGAGPWGVSNLPCPPCSLSLSPPYSKGERVAHAALPLPDSTPLGTARSHGPLACRELDMFDILADYYVSTFLPLPHPPELSRLLSSILHFLSLEYWSSCLPQGSKAVLSPPRLR